MLTGLLAQRGFGFLIDFLLKCQLACLEKQQKKADQKLEKNGEKRMTHKLENITVTVYIL